MRHSAPPGHLTAALVEEVRYLRRCMRDLVAFGALKASWTGRAPREIATSFADAMLSLLNAEVVLVRFGGASWEAMDVLRTSCELPIGEEGPLLERLVASIDADNGVPFGVPHLLGAGDAVVMVTTAGTIDERAWVVAGSTRYGFPDDFQRAMLGIGVGQLAFALREHQLLERSREGLQRAEIALRESEQRFRSAFDGAPIGMALVAIDGRWIQVNTSLCQFLGYTARELTERRFQDLTHPDDLDLDLEQRARLVAGEIGSYSLEKRFFHKSGHVVWALLHVSLVRDDGGQPLHYITQIKDIDQAKRAERERARRVEQLQALADAALAIGAAASTREIVEVMTSEAGRIFGARAAKARLTPGQNGDQAIHARGWFETPIPDREVSMPDGLDRLVCESNRPARRTQAEIEALGARGDGVGRAPAGGWVGVPLCGRDGGNIGLLQLIARSGSDFGEDEEAMLVQLAQIASQAAENARLLQEVTHARALLETLSRRLVTVQEEERRTIARELHDEVGQILTGLKLMIETHARTESALDLVEIEDLAGTLVERVRDLSLNLRPPMLDDMGLAPTLLWAFERYRKQTGIEVRFKHHGLRRYPPESEIAAFRILQEALTNVARHSGVDEVTVEVWAERGMLRLRVDDEGNGFDPRALPVTSSGLVGMRERARLAGGTLTIESRPGTGTRLFADLPLHPPTPTGGSDQHGYGT